MIISGTDYYKYLAITCHEIWSVHLGCLAYSSLYIIAYPTLFGTSIFYKLGLPVYIITERFVAQYVILFHIDWF